MPICKTRCIYCDFFSQTDQSVESSLIEAISSELELTAANHETSSAQTIYLGGGTPSLFQSSSIQTVLDKIKRLYASNQTTPEEITIEINPDDISPALLAEYTQMGINRISLGVQSFQDTELKFMSRRHNSSQNIKALELIQKSEIENYSLDLIFALPDQTLEQFEESILSALIFQPKHISLYCLTYEKNTKLYEMLQTSQISQLQTDLQNRMYLLAVNKLQEAGYHHYEISNFALPGFESKHNLNYWKRGNYLGFGPSAHSCVGNFRFANIADIGQYIDNLKNNQLPRDLEEQLTKSQRLTELVLTSLRLDTGLDLDEYQQISGFDVTETKADLIEKLTNRKLAKLDNRHLILTTTGFLLSDEISAALI